MAVSLLPVFQSVKWRPVRASMFAGLGLWGAVPVLHQWATQSHIWAVRKALVYDGIMGAIYLVGGWLGGRGWLGAWLGRWAGGWWSVGCGWVEIAMGDGAMGQG